MFNEPFLGYVEFTQYRIRLQNEIAYHAFLAEDTRKRETKQDRSKTSPVRPAETYTFP